MTSEERAAEAGVELARSSAPPGGKVLDPIAVLGPGGLVDSWFVPVAVGDQLVGYARTGRGGPSYSAFGSPQPRAAWTDAGKVRRLVEAAGHSVAGEPFLSYDGAPARLAWAVPLADGAVAYVAGEAVWRGAAAGEVT